MLKMYLHVQVSMLCITGCSKTFDHLWWKIKIITINTEIIGMHVVGKGSWTGGEVGKFFPSSS